MTITLHGIRNCDTVRRARAWLDAAGVDYRFHDFRRDGIDAATLGAWADAVGWQVLLNRRGTTFRGLPEAERDVADQDAAIALMVVHPALIKRPVLTGAGVPIVGFSPERYADAGLASGAAAA